MISQTLRKVTPQVSRNFTGRRSYSSFDRDFQLLANAMTRDFERSFGARRGFGPWDFFAPRSSFFSEPAVFYEPVRSTYEKKTILNDENGRILVKTMRKSPGRPWETYVEEYVSDKAIGETKKPEALEQSNKSEASSQHKEQQQQQQTKEQVQEDTSAIPQTKQTIEKTDKSQAAKTTEATADQKQPSKDQVSMQPQSDALSLFDQQFQELSESMTRDFDSFFGTRSNFGRWGWFEPERLSFDPENTSYSMKSVVNNNGNVTVKTTTKTPGSEWKTSVEQYTRDGAVEGQKRTEAIGESSGQKTNEDAVNNQTSGKEQTASQ